ncbi:MAG: glutathione S-transferase family protein [Rhodospirillales bacterium]|nr:glutathione S-transferase family protein [Rhodospirillales bacterium]
MSLTLYDLSGTEGLRFSPYCWRAKLALAHKELSADTVPVTFGEKDKLVFSGQDRVPVLVDGETTVPDSWNIACYLEDTYLDRPSLFGGEIGRAEALFLNNWADKVLNPGIFPLIVSDIGAHIPAADQVYFRSSREQRLGKTLEAAEADREGLIEGFRRSLGPLRAVLAQQKFVAGARPAYADYIMFGSFQWARLTSAYGLLEKEDPIFAWRNRMLGLFGGLAEAAGGYPL